MNDILEFFGISALADYPYLFFILQGALVIIVITELFSFLSSIIRDLLHLSDR